ncbi:MAG: VOC family protein [Calditrichia bacterium]
MKSFVTVLMLLLIPFTLFSQDDPISDPEPYFTAMIVSNIDTTLEWYTNNLGFEMVSRVDLEERGLRMANLKCGKAWIELIELKGAVSPGELMVETPKKIRIIGLFKIGYLVAELDQWVTRLKNAGVEFNGDVVKDQHSGRRMVIVKDPDGNRVQLFEK